MLTEGEKEFVEAFSEWVSAEGVECGFTGGGFRLRCGDSPLSRSERTVTWTWKSAEDFCRVWPEHKPGDGVTSSIFELARMFRWIGEVRRRRPIAPVDILGDAGKAFPKIPAFEALKAKLILLASCASLEEAVVIMGVAGR